MKILLFFFANLVARAIASNTIRGSGAQVEEPAEVLNKNRGHFLKDTTCVLYQRCVTFLSSEHHPKGYNKHYWVCKLSNEDSARFNTKSVNIVERFSVAGVLSNAISGTSTLTMSEAFIDVDGPQLFVPNHARVELGTIHKEIPETNSQRHLTSTIGTLNTLVIRVSDKNGNTPDLSLNNLRDDVFDDAVSLKTQMEACSYGKLKIKPFVGYTPSNVYIENGIVEMKMDYDVFSDQGDIGIESENAAWRFLGDLDDPMFDLILFCLPSGRESFGAYADLVGKMSWYDNETCNYGPVLLHEVGHNLGLEHSGELGESEYGDGTGLMGVAPFEDDAKICFNAQKNYQLEWYSDQVESIDPIDGTGSRNFVLNGASDYQKNKDALIVLRLEQTSMVQDYYVGYNRAGGIHADVTEDRNKVIIIRKENGAPNTVGFSSKMAALMPGESHVITNFNGYQSITIAYLTENNGNANIEVVDNGPSPTPAPGSCKEFTIEFTTDYKKGDNSWVITDLEGLVVAEEPSFLYGGLRHSKRVCLPLDDSPKTYLFSVKDTNGDGVCCNQGYGMYRVFDDEGEVYVSSDFRDEDFFSKEYKIDVLGRDMQPTCKRFIIKFTTNAHPLDNSWVITDTEGTIIVEQSSFEDPWKEYSTNSCLPMDITPKTYTFTVMDSFGDGVCCEYGNGSYAVIDGTGKEYVSSNFQYEAFEFKQFSIEVPGIEMPPSSPPPTTSPPTQVRPCKTTKKAFRLKKGGRKKKCKWFKSKGFCDNSVTTGQYNGKYVWELCGKNCNRC